MREVILDTNFLLIPGYFKVDIISEIERICTFPYRLSIIDGTLRELHKIIDEQKGQSRSAARIGKQLIEKNHISIIQTDFDGTVDDAIVDYAKKNNSIVATEDKELIRKLRKNKIGVIIIRQKKYLKLEE